ncbi:MAG TPA: penicillin-binding protein 2, partial [Aquifex aeolicus]|nr:penicillin-binding protein 2 [Aquifex aeolicus]
MKRRSFLVMLLSAIGSFIVITVNLFRLQILEGKKYRELSERNYIRRRYLYPPRGDIYDRNGKKLAYDIPRYVMVLDVNRLRKKELETVIEEIRKLFGIEIDKERVLRRGFEPFVVKIDLTPSEIEKFYRNKYKLPGVFIEAMPKRIYPLNDLGSHV